MKNFSTCRFLILLALLNGAAFGLLAAEWRPPSPAQSAVSAWNGNDLPDAVSGEYKIQVFPNPNAGRFRLQVEGTFADTVELVIINVEGKRVYQRSIAQAGEFLFNLTPLRKGIYFAQIRVDNKVVSCPILYAYDPEDSGIPVNQPPRP